MAGAFVFNACLGINRMKLRLVLALLASLAVAACAPKQPETTPTAPAAGESAPAPAASAETAAAPTAATPAAESAPEAPRPPPTPYTGPALVPGVDYVEIPGGQPFEPLAGKVEVVEFFNYICPACYSFKAPFERWEAQQAADVRVTLVPATFRADFTTYAKVYYAAEALGVANKSHDAVYQAIHLQRALPGEGDQIDEDKIAAFYAPYGADAATFKATMNSFAVAGKVNRAKQFMTRSQIGGTPSLVVNGKYLVSGGKSWEDMLRVADGLVAQERARSGG